MYGFSGKVLRVDLNSQTISNEPLNEKWVKDFIGARGLGVRYLAEEIDPAIDPLSEGNKLIFATGPATGTRVIGGSRYEVVTKAPLTGTIGTANASDLWGPELKFTGWDMIIFEGKAEKPVYLWIQDDSVEIRPAQELWGKETTETQKIVKERTHPKAKIACIGPAGEKQVLFACIMNDVGHAAGRGGVGAVMGAKNLKAVAVKGSGSVPMAEEETLKTLVKQIWSKQPKAKDQFLHQLGTAGVLEIANEVGVFPTRNFQTGVFEGAEKISGQAVRDTILTKRKACFSCPAGCSPMTRTIDPEFEGEGAGPEYEGLYSLGGCCGIENLSAVVKAYYICNEMGMDVITAGVTIACAMELFQRGYLTENEIGMPLRFGDAKALVAILPKIGHRQGFGDVLAEGSRRLAQRYGHPELSISVKGLEPAGYDPRGAMGLGLAYATSTRGACHMRSQFEDIEPLGLIYPEIGVLEPTDRFAFEGKPALVAKMENDKASIDSMGICTFLSGYNIGLANVVAQLEAVTGIEYGIDGWLQAGERTTNLEKMFNLGAGLTSEDDTLPKRFMKEPMPEGPSQGSVCQIEEMLADYYEQRGWDKNGVPTQAKLKELDLLEFAKGASWYRFLQN
ncbi:MAG: aldehyde ferredoxin oxidoreductase family protein [Deltaproteobacteria bacterium]|nr:aldehyde ferredoxin oxidoreductase family protein [Deltaproteobacteria bacterium]